jgi:peptidoglycan/xylan/chitin deacetylase (PgdA/CDA1 family)
MEISRREFLKGMTGALVYGVLNVFPESCAQANHFRLTSEDIYRGDTKKKMIALTFDGVLKDNALTSILEANKNHESLSTFFLTGESIKKFPERVKRIYENGHEIGNHTYSHSHLTTYEQNRKQNTRKGINKDFVHQELMKTEEEFYKLCKKNMAPLWRAPFGEENQEIREWARDAGYQHVRWTFDTLDWVDDENSGLYIPTRTVRNSLINIEQKHKNGLKGYIILMHTGNNRKNEPLHKELNAIMTDLKERRYSFAKVSEII